VRASVKSRARIADNSWKTPRHRRRVARVSLPSTKITRSPAGCYSLASRLRIGKKFDWKFLAEYCERWGGPDSAMRPGASWSEIRVSLILFAERMRGSKGSSV